jgi:hypothetical protein
MKERKNKVIYKLHELYKQNNSELSQEEKELWQEQIMNKFQTPTQIKTKEVQKEAPNIYIDEKHIFDLISLALQIE